MAEAEDGAVGVKGANPPLEEPHASLLLAKTGEDLAGLLALSLLLLFHDAGLFASFTELPTMYSAGQASFFLITLSCSMSICLLWPVLTFSFTTLPIFCCSLFSSHYFLRSLREGGGLEARIQGGGEEGRGTKGREGGGDLGGWGGPQVLGMQAVHVHIKGMLVALVGLEGVQAALVGLGGVEVEMG